MVCRLLPSVSSFTFESKNGVTFLPHDSVFFRFLQRLQNDCLDLAVIKRILLRYRVGDDKTAVQTELPLRIHHGCDFFWSIQTEIDAKAALSCEEGRELIRAIADDRHPLCLQVFEGTADIENRLASGAYDCEARLRQLGQVSRHVPGDFAFAVNTADAACGKNADACQLGCDHRTGLPSSP